MSNMEALKECLEALRAIVDSPIGEELANKNELLDLIAKAEEG